MPTRTSSLINSGDRVVITLAGLQTIGRVIQFLLSGVYYEIGLADWRLVRRSIFERRVYIVWHPETTLVLGCAMFLPGLNEGQLELTNLLIHPSIRGLGIGTRLVQAQMMHRFGNEYETTGMHFYAHTTLENEATYKALNRSGFRKWTEATKLNPKNVSAIAHMLRPGESEVQVHRFDFNKTALDTVVLDLLYFCEQQNKIEIRGDFFLNVEFDERLVNIEGLRAHAQHLAQKSINYVPPPSNLPDDDTDTAASSKKPKE